MIENLDHPGIDMDRPAPYAGFYANLVGVSNSTKIIFLVEFSLLFLMGIMMYGFYLRERHIKSKIKFTKTGLGASQSEVGGTRTNNRLSS